MPKEDFVVLHGSVRTQDGVIGKLGTVSLDADDAKRMDPHGKSLKLKRLWDAEQKGLEAGKAATAAALAEVSEEPKATEPEHKPAPVAAKGKHK